KQNGRVERFHQTVEYEYLHYQDLYPDIELLRGYCMAFNQKYNHQRLHKSLGYQTPAEYVKSNVVTKEQVLRHV
ncbi:MAG: transposase, partial [Patescibacteria group bacterium]|nr:transposase [Patescibacteria group bacterium]